MELQSIEMGGDFLLKVSSAVCAASLLVLLLRHLLAKPPKKNPLPTVRSPILTYLSVLKSFYNSKSKDTPIMCLALQCTDGFSKACYPNRIFQFYLGFQPVVVLFKPETVEAVLSSTTVINKANQYSLFNSWLGAGLLTSNGEKWRSRRKLLTPAFHFRILEDFLPVFQEHSLRLTSRLSSSSSHWVDIVPLLTACTLDIICETAMGVQIDAQGSDRHEYAEAIHEVGDCFFYRALRPWLYPDFLFNLSSAGRNYKKNVRLIIEFTRKVIREKKAEMTARKTSRAEEEPPTDSPSHGRKRLPFLELLLEHHLRDPSLTEEDIREEVDTFMFEGHDTTAMALSWTLYLLGQDERVQQKVINELDDIFGDDRDREMTRQDLASMKYLECVIKETLRLHPSVPIFGRKALEPLEISNYTVEKGSVCLVLPWTLHRDPDSFEQPERFVPERFLPENCAGRHPYAYVPFSAGPRNCIGQKFALMEEKTVLASVLRRFRVRSLDPRDKVNITANLVLRNVQPLRLHFTPRADERLRGGA